MTTLGRAILYCRQVEKTAAFYERHFGYQVLNDPTDRIVELRSPSDGLVLLLHPAGKGQKQGQVQLKLVFDVADVPAMRAALVESGVEVGPLHHANGYVFANLKDPSGNALSISGQAFR